MAARLEGRSRDVIVQYWLGILLLALLFVVSTAPSPLYAVYQARWHFSAAALTAVFAIYAGTVMISLNLFGSASDRSGRRRLVLAGLSLVLASLILFALARGVAWILAARALQGLGVGTASVALVAAVGDSAPAGASPTAATATSMASSLAMAIGSLGAGLFVEYVADASVWLFVMLAALTGLSLVAAWRISDREFVDAPAEARRAFRVRVPRYQWAAFTIYAAGLSVAWAVSGLYLALAPSISLAVSSHGGRLAGAVAVAILGSVAASMTFLTRSWSERRLISRGTPPLAAGLFVVIAACLVRSDAWFLIGSAVLASGWGLVNIGSFRGLFGLAEEGRRAELVAAIYLVAYVAFSVPVLVAGVAIDHFGLRSTTVVFGVVAAGVSLAVAVLILLVDRSGAGLQDLRRQSHQQVEGGLCPADRRGG